MSGFIEESYTFTVPPPAYGGSNVGGISAPPLGIHEETVVLSREDERLNRHIANKPLGAAGQAYLHEEEQRAQQQQRRGPAKHESWVDLHNEYADILDQQELAKFRRHFRAFGANDDGFLTVEGLKDTMETFFGQDLTRAQIVETIAQIDYDGDGQLSYREFLEAMCGLKSGARTKFGSFYKVITLKNPAFWVQRVGRANSAI